jgi:hypothetical protein
VLAQYIIALLKNNAEEKMRDACLNQLDVFLQPGVLPSPFRAAEQAKQSFLAADMINCHAMPQNVVGFLRCRYFGLCGRPLRLLEGVRNADGRACSANPSVR